ncbi:transcriptional corepressor SEUSS-like [Pyrus ussuriensis x Pyrus communis]|uniref:Transcriptional corepressor SEUSS-like n=1 Tax=Pyrus ussuriensis x Pyrus communis TaxID=2448454 RepID=A0A5N5F103_9ROSA|nr:transcriptional corepressor SEUSS-like [Pyrus ussuriensis x Pyrus communis]
MILVYYLQAPNAKDAGNGSISKFSAIALPTDTNTLNKLRALHHGLNNQKNNHHQMVSHETTSYMAKCTTCGLMFSTKDDLDKHNLLVCEDFEKFLCFNCGIVTHAKMAHWEEYEGKFVCNSCKHIFITTADHMTTAVAAVSPVARSVTRCEGGDL